ncbi:sulfurtransferase TusA family protein [Pseudothauera nasutitermitis]|uniref:Sulfurtransferase TusA family protein n=1 Tax=Pseudothauera nasutitermitis TaxID=2565930 RepID=A0A4V3WC91_9RHOO|nr:sulfurtransferase TusA family protein [Pseudothauera nasutitermitis]THF66288.1 sulfurtransferase TusA family protein [Pseudothauera nasutitermitis]
MSKVILDVKNLNCPLPVIHTRKAMRNLESGAVLEILTTDPASIRDFNALCRSTGSDLINQSESQGIYTFQIRKGA